MTDDLGLWAEAPSDSIANRTCPGSDIDFIFRRCHANGSWAPVDDADTSACAAPVACDVCQCYNCGGDGERLCGAAVGLQTGSRDHEFFADCSHAYLIVGPRAFPPNTTRIDLQGNTMLQRFDSDAFAGASQVYRICESCVTCEMAYLGEHTELLCCVFDISLSMFDCRSRPRTPITSLVISPCCLDLAGLVRLTSFPEGLFDPLSSLEIFDTVDLHSITSFPSELLHRVTSLRTFIAHFWGITSLQRPFEACPRLDYVEISSCQALTLRGDELFGTQIISYFALYGSNAITAMPDNIFGPLAASVAELHLKYNHNLRTLPVPLMTRPENSPPLSLYIRGNPQLTAIEQGTFSGLQNLTRFVLESGSSGLNAADGMFDDIGFIQTLDIYGLHFSNATRGIFRGLTSAQAVRFHGLTTQDNVEVSDPMAPGLTFRDLSNCRELVMDTVNVATLTPGLFGGMTLLEDLELKCVPITVLSRDVLTSDNRVLSSFRVVMMPNLTHVMPYAFYHGSNLKSIDLSANPQLESLEQNTFDGAFRSSTASSFHIILTDSVLSSVSKRAFNFDSLGLPSKTVVTIATASGSDGLDTCCGCVLRSLC